MPTSYSGDPTSYPTSYDIPSDGDLRSAASVDVGLEKLGDRTAYLKAQQSPLRVVSVTEVGSASETSIHSWSTATFEPGPTSETQIALDGLLSGDVVVAWAAWAATVAATGAELGDLALFVDRPSPHSTITIPHAISTIGLAGTGAAANIGSMAMVGQFTCPADGDYLVFLGGRARLAAGSLDIASGAIVVTVYRPTP